MKCEQLKKWWRNLFDKDTKPAFPEAQGLPRIRVAPLSVGLRIDMAVSTWDGQETEASQFIWVTPTGSSGPGNALRVLLIPN